MQASSQVPCTKQVWHYIRNVRTNAAEVRLIHVLSGTGGPPGGLGVPVPPPKAVLGEAGVSSGTSATADTDPFAVPH